MKNLLKFGFLGLALTFMVAACNEPAAQEGQDVEVITDGDVIINEADSADTTVIAVEEVVADSAAVK